MSYARFGWDQSDVYVYSTKFNGKDFIVCAMCYFGDEMEGSFYAESTLEMLDHLKAHQKAGHLVPHDTFDALITDDPENFPNNPLS